MTQIKETLKSTQTQIEKIAKDPNFFENDKEKHIAKKYQETFDSILDLITNLESTLQTPLVTQPEEGSSTQTPDLSPQKTTTASIGTQNIFIEQNQRQQSDNTDQEKAEKDFNIKIAFCGGGELNSIKNDFTIEIKAGDTFEQVKK